MVSSEVSLPQIVFLDAANSPHLSDLITGADNFTSHMCARLDHGVLVIRVLRRRSIGVVFDVPGNQLQMDCSTLVLLRLFLFHHS